MYGSLKNHLTLSENSSTLLEVCGLNSVELRPILKPKLAKWEWEIEAYVATMKLETIHPVLPVNLLAEITDWVDKEFDECTLVVKAMLWYFIGDAMAHIANSYIDEKVKAQFLREMKITDIRNNSITG